MFKHMHHLFEHHSKHVEMMRLQYCFTWIISGMLKIWAIPCSIAEWKLVNVCMAVVCVSSQPSVGISTRSDIHTTILYLLDKCIFDFSFESNANSAQCYWFAFLSIRSIWGFMATHVKWPSSVSSSSSSPKTHRIGSVCTMCWPVKCFIGDIEKLKFQSKFRLLLCDTFSSINEFCSIFALDLTILPRQIKYVNFVLWMCVTIFQRIRFIRWFYAPNKLRADKFIT